MCSLIHLVTASAYADFTKVWFACRPFALSDLLSPLTWWRLVSHTLGAKQARLRDMLPYPSFSVCLGSSVHWHVLCMNRMRESVMAAIAPGSTTCTRLMITALSRSLSLSLGHSSWQHLSGNVSLILLVGPPCEKARDAAFLFCFLAADESGFAAHKLGLARR